MELPIYISFRTYPLHCFQLVGGGKTLLRARETEGCKSLSDLRPPADFEDSVGSLEQLIHRPRQTYLDIYHFIETITYATVCLLAHLDTRLLVEHSTWMN